MSSNPNVRRKKDETGGVVEYIDPFADWAEMLFSKQGLALVIGADLFVNDGGLLGAGFDLAGEAATELGEIL